MRTCIQMYAVHPKRFTIPAVGTLEIIIYNHTLSEHMLGTQSHTHTHRTGANLATILLIIRWAFGALVSYCEPFLDRRFIICVDIAEYIITSNSI